MASTFAIGTTFAAPTAASRCPEVFPRAHLHPRGAPPNRDYVADLETESTRTSSPLTRPDGTFAPFRYPAFRAIWIANLASNLGSMIQSVAAAWLMTDLTSSHRLIALVQASA